MTAWLAHASACARGGTRSTCSSNAAPRSFRIWSKLSGDTPITSGAPWSESPRPVARSDGPEGPVPRRANERFAQLQRDLADTENNVAYARTYNGAVETYSVRAAEFPEPARRRRLWISARGVLRGRRSPRIPDLSRTSADLVRSVVPCPP